MQKHKAPVTFEIGDLIPIVVTLAVAGLVTAFSLQVVGETKEDMGESACENNATPGFWNTTSQRCETSGTNSTHVQGNPSEFNASGDVLSGMAVIPEKFSIIATVAVAAVVIGLLLTYFLGRLTR